MKSVKPDEFAEYPRDEWISRFDSDRKPILAHRKGTDEPMQIEFAG